MLANSPPADEGPVRETLIAALSNAATLEARILAISSAVPGRIAFSTSLGLEDQAVLYAIAASGAGPRIV